MIALASRCGATKIEWKIWNTREANHSIVAYFHVYFHLSEYTWSWGFEFWSGETRTNASQHQRRFDWDFSRGRSWEIFLIVYVALAMCQGLSARECWCAVNSVFFVQLFIAYIWRIRHERHTWDRKHCNPVHATIHSFDGQHDSIHISIVRFHLEENLLFFFSMGAVGHFPHFLSVLRPCRKLRNIYRVQWHRFSLFGTAAAMCSQRIKFYVWTLHNRTAALKREGASRR